MRKVCKIFAQKISAESFYEIKKLARGPPCIICFEGVKSIFDLWICTCANKFRFANIRERIANFLKPEWVGTTNPRIQDAFNFQQIMQGPGTWTWYWHKQGMLTLAEFRYDFRNNFPQPFQCKIPLMHTGQFKIQNGMLKPGMNWHMWYF